MGLEEKSLSTGRDRGQRQHGDELARATADAFGTLTGLLHAVGSVEDHRRTTRIAQAREGPHVHDEISVAEKGPALCHRDVARASVRAGTTADFLHGATHPFRLEPLPFFHV